MIATEPPTERPDPSQYTGHWTMRDGRRVLIRPIRPDDELLLARFHAALSLTTVYARYSQVLPLRCRTEHERLVQRCTVDYDEQFALVAIDLDEPETMVAVARLSKMPHNDAEFAIVIADSHQRAGLGTRLLSQLIEVARDEGRKRLFGYINSDNTAMCAVCRQFGFELDWPASGPTRTAILHLSPV